MIKHTFLPTLFFSVFLFACSENIEHHHKSEYKKILSDATCEESISNYKKNIGREILSQTPDNFLVAYYKAVMRYRHLLRSKSASQTDLDAARIKLEETLSNALNNVTDKKIPYNRPISVKNLSLISGHVKNQNDEQKIFEEVFKLSETEAAGVLRLILDAITNKLPAQ